MNTHTLFTPSVWRGRDAVAPGDGSTHADAGGLGETLYDRVEALATQEQKELPETLSPQHIRLADLAGQLNDMDFDEIFTKNKPAIFAFPAYPRLIHRLTYRRTNHDNIHVRGYKEEGTIATPFDMMVLNDLDRFHLVMETVDRLPRTWDKGIHLKQQLNDKLGEHKQYINKNGEDLLELGMERDQRSQTGANRAGSGENVYYANDPR